MNSGALRWCLDTLSRGGEEGVGSMMTIDIDMPLLLLRGCYERSLFTVGDVRWHRIEWPSGS